MTTKEQERAALAKIRKIVDGLGKGSYIGIAFEGCFQDAEENIEYDFGCSMKQRYEATEAKLDEAEDQLTAAHVIRENLEKTNKALQDRIEALIEHAKGVGNLMENATDDLNKTKIELYDIKEKYETAQNEIMKLKAKLYDLMMKEA